MTAPQIQEKMKKLERRVISLEAVLGIAKKRTLTTEQRHVILERTAGMLRGKLPKNLSAWQRRARSSWK